MTETTRNHEPADESLCEINVELEEQLRRQQAAVARGERGRSLSEVADELEMSESPDPDH